MPLVVLSAPGQAGDAPMFPILMGHPKVNTSGPGRPVRARPRFAATRRIRRGPSAHCCAAGASPRRSPSLTIRSLTVGAAAAQEADRRRSTLMITRAATSLSAASNEPNNGEASPPATTNTT
ncbi:putative transposase [Mycobacterium kansasii]|uniref:Putative transposase n=1 Tax=Mycobacterium kansasii TaxID=1768 RepID=A0A1V3XSK8_MYCKA|nr:putative transposase [Mycobacterium kansasii]